MPDPKATKKKCFIITPIGDPNTDTRRRAEGVIDEVLCPVLKDPEFDYDVIIPHRVSDPGSITKQIISDIYDSELVIANLTGLNPNVMYELSFRHSCGKPTIHICENGTKLPFDLKDQRTIFYENDMAGAFQLKSDFCAMVKGIYSLTEDMDNPIYNGLEKRQITKIISEQKTESSETVILKMLSAIMNEIERKPYRGDINNIFSNINKTYSPNKKIDITCSSIVVTFSKGSSPFSISNISYEISSRFLDNTQWVIGDQKEETEKVAFIKFLIGEISIDSLNELRNDIYKYLFDSGYRDISVSVNPKEKNLSCSYSL
jgi:hypothetical protein